MESPETYCPPCAGGGMGTIIPLILSVVIIAGMWKVFTKAGQPGWAVIIPFYNAYVMLKIAGKPGWWLVLFFIPVVGIVIGIIAVAAMAGKFGKGAGYTIGLILLPFIFYPMLGFGDAQYQGAGPEQA